MAIQNIEKIIFTLLLTIFTLLSTGCSKKEEREVRLGMVQWIGYSPLYVAEAKGLLPKQLRIIDYSSNYDIIESIKDGVLEAACLTLDEAIELISHGIKLHIILVLDISNGADALLASSDIQNIKDLKGKRVAYEPKSVQEYLLMRALEKNNIDIKEIQSVFLKYNAQMNGWINKDFDALATYEPLKTKLINAGMHTIFDSSQIEGEIVDLLIVTESALKESPKTLQKIVDAWFKGLKYIEVNNKTNNIISEYLHIPINSINNALNGIILTNYAKNMEMIGPKFKKITKTGKHIVNFMIKQKIIQQNIKIEPLIKSKFIQKVYP